jgi:uncharacterized damage-inducible protein DinB
MDPQLFRNHIAYSNWATNRLLIAAAELSPEQLNHDFGTADKSVAGTLLHLFRAERVWLQRVKRQPQTYMVHGDGFESLKTDWLTIQSDWEDWISTVTSNELVSEFEYQDLKGRPRSNVVWEVLLHVVNHSTHHRGQISGFLRSLGHVPASLDYISWVRERPATATQGQQPTT